MGRRGVLFTIEQAAWFVKATADARMWHYDWAPSTIDAKATIAGIKALGVDVSAWTGERDEPPS